MEQYVLKDFMKEKYKEKSLGFEVYFKIMQNKEINYVIVVFIFSENDEGIDYQLNLFYDKILYNYEEYKIYFDEILNMFKQEFEKIVDEKKISTEK